MEVGLGFAGSGALILEIAAFLIGRARRFRQTDDRARDRRRAGESTTGEGSHRYAPVVRFATAEGRTVRFTIG